MRNSTPQLGEGRYVELHDGSLLLRERDRERLNDRVAWLPEAERERILEEAWLRGPDVYDEIDPEACEVAQPRLGVNKVASLRLGLDEVTQIWKPKVERRSEKLLKILKLEGIRTQTGQLAQECVDEVLAVVDELRGVVRRHMRAFLIAGGLVTGASAAYAAAWAVLNSDSGPIPVAHAAEQAPDKVNCEKP